MPFILLLAVAVAAAVRSESNFSSRIPAIHHPDSDDVNNNMTVQDAPFVDNDTYPLKSAVDNQDSTDSLSFFASFFLFYEPPFFGPSFLPLPSLPFAWFDSLRGMLPGVPLFLPRAPVFRGLFPSFLTSFASFPCFSPTWERYFEDESLFMDEMLGFPSGFWPSDTMVFSLFYFWLSLVLVILSMVMVIFNPENVKRFFGYALEGLLSVFISIWTMVKVFLR